MPKADSSWGNDPVQSMSSMPEGDFSTLMDKTFGAGKWRLTGGYRSPAREKELRAEGAKTVAPGHTSAHSLGTDEAPGAYDVVVDGVSPVAAAERLRKTGGGFHKLYPEENSGGQGAHLHVEPYMTDGSDWGAGDEQIKPDGVIKGPADKPSGRKVTSLDPRSRTLTSTPRQRLMENATEPVRSLPGDIGHAFMEAGRATADVVKAGEARLADKDKRVLSGHSKATDFLPDVHAITDTAKVAGNTLAQVVSPVAGALRSFVGRPVENATGSPTAGRIAEDVAGVAVPVAGEARIAADAAKIAREEGISLQAARQVAQRRMAAPPAPQGGNVLKRVTEKMADKDPAHLAAVRRLKAAGVKPAAHQEAGGSARRLVESAKSNPYVGEGVRESEREAGDSFNRALYNKVLEPLGEKVPDTFPVGRDGIRAMKTKMDREYQAVLPHVRITGDKDTIDQLAAIRTAAAKLGQPQEKQFEAILNQDVLHHFVTGGMDGKTFKTVESDLLRQARNFKGSGDPNQRELGRRLEDVVDVLRQDMVDHSPAQYRARLQALNASYARFTRLEDAATRRQGGGGTITPQDLLASVKKGDHTVRKGAFARGDALLQDFAEDADRVLTPKVNDSGTTERLLANRALAAHGVMGVAGAGAGMVAGGPAGAFVGGAVGAAGDMAASRVTNMLARRALSRAPRAPVPPQNYLKAAQNRSLASAAPVAATLPRPQPGGP